MANNGQKAAALMAAVCAACAVSAVPLFHDEGYAPKAKGDPTRGMQMATVCAGVTEGVLPNKTYTDAECAEKTAAAELKIAFAISKCLPDQLPTLTRSAFQRVAYNVGPGAFCASPISAYARQGNLGRSCGAIHDYHVLSTVPEGKPWPCKAEQRVVAKDGRRLCKLPGLVTRRAGEQATCEEGLRR